MYNFGQATALGSLTLAAGRTAIDIEATSSGCGYWVIDSVGVFHRFGDAGLIPQANLASLVSLYDFGIAPDCAESVVSVIPSYDGTGAYVFTSIGRVFRPGTAPACPETEEEARPWPWWPSAPWASGAPSGHSAPSGPSQPS